MVLFHGLEGSSASHYAQAFAVEDLPRPEFDRERGVETNTKTHLLLITKGKIGLVREELAPGNQEISGGAGIVNCHPCRSSRGACFLG